MTRLLGYFIVIAAVAPLAPWAAQQQSAADEPALEPEGGAFSRLSNQRRRAKYFIPPGVLPANVPPSQTTSVRLPGDFQRHEALLLAGGALARECPGVLAQIVTAVKDRLAVVAMVAGRQERRSVLAELAASGLPPDAVRLVEVPTETMWVRDYGPLFVNRADGHRVAVDTEYQIDQRREDNAVPAALARHFKTTVVAAPILLEGGNLLSNGRGVCLTTTTINHNVVRGYDARTIAKLLLGHFGCRQTVVLEPLRGEMSGHVDVFACFTSPDTIVLGAYHRAVDPLNAAILDRNAERLARLDTPHGKLRVVRVPMPPNDDGKFRTYTNGIFANGILLLPRYAGVDAAIDQRAVETFRRLLPDWELARIDADTLIRHDGALRCISAYVPPVGDARHATPHGP